MKACASLFKFLLVLGSIGIAMILIIQSQPGRVGVHWFFENDELLTRQYENQVRSEQQSGILVPTFLQGLNLTKDQHDAIFTILKTQAPRVLAHEKVIHNTQELLISLVMSEHYKESEVQSLSRVLSDALTELFLIRTRSESQIYALLTEVQRKQVDSMKNKSNAQLSYPKQGNAAVSTHFI